MCVYGITSPIRMNASQKQTIARQVFNQLLAKRRPNTTPVMNRSVTGAQVRSGLYDMIDVYVIMLNLASKNPQLTRDPQSRQFFNTTKLQLAELRQRIDRIGRTRNAGGAGVQTQLAQRKGIFGGFRSRIGSSGSGQRGVIGRSMNFVRAKLPSRPSFFSRSRKG